MTEQGKLFIVSAPSGAGKTTLIRRVLPEFDSLAYSVSHTTRSPRDKEQEGVDYFFVTPEEFESRIDQDLWLEWARVHDNYYGTSKAFVRDTLAAGKSLLLDIDVQGACQIMDSDFDPVTVFITPPSFDVLAERLNKRGTDSPAVIEKRLKNAKEEVAFKDRYRHVIVNDDLETAVNALRDIFRQELGPI